MGSGVFEVEKDWMELSFGMYYAKLLNPVTEDKVPWVERNLVHYKTYPHLFEDGNEAQKFAH